QPPGFEDPYFPDKVYKVEKALYGLHQAPRAWCMLMISSLGLQRSLYVISLKKDDGIFISQDKYVAKILKKFDFATAKTASTLIETNKALVKDEEDEAIDIHLYISMIGSLMYLTASRPDIIFFVCACARFQVTPKTSHIHAVKRIFRYLKGQPKLGLWYPRDSPFDLEAFSDSDYAGVSLDRESTTREIRHLFIRDSYEKKLIQVIKIHTDHNVADLLTKAFDVSRKAKRTTEISQSSGPIHLVANETVYKEWEDRMERAATTASSLEAEQEIEAQSRFEAASK
ncbi:hypothetical protein Tco_1131669, partial [Tanacetum coccineum]